MRKMTRPLLASLLLLILTGCASGPITRPNSREWSALEAEYRLFDSQRRAAPIPSVSASRREQIEVRLATLRKLESSQTLFMERLREYHERTSDARAGTLLASEKVRLGNEYADLLSRYDRAIELYNSALAIDPGNVEATQRLAQIKSQRYVELGSFSAVKKGMKQDDVRRILGLPREDWIKQIVQKGKVYSVWIYPKEDGGASAVYFDNGVVYFVNWNAAATRQTGS